MRVRLLVLAVAGSGAIAASCGGGGGGGGGGGPTVTPAVDPTGVMVAALAEHAEPVAATNP